MDELDYYYKDIVDAISDAETDSSRFVFEY